MGENLDLIGVFNAVDLCIIIIDVQCRVTLINQYAKDELSTDNASFIGSNISDILPAIQSRIQKCIETGEAQFVDKLKYQSTFFAGKAVAIKKKKSILGVAFSFQSLKSFGLPDSKIESYNLLNDEVDAIFKSSSYGYWLCDGEGTVLKVNKAAERHTGIEAKEIVGQKAWYLEEKGFVDHSVTAEVVKSRKRVRMI